MKLEFISLVGTSYSMEVCPQTDFKHRAGGRQWKQTRKGGEGVYGLLKMERCYL